MIHLNDDQVTTSTKQTQYTEMNYCSHSETKTC